MKESKRLNPFGRFCCTIGNLPTSYMLSLTYEEQLIWFCKYLEETVIPAVNNNAEALEELQNLFIELKTYVDEYFENLDIQTEINNKLDEMAESGELADIIAQYIELQGILAYDTIDDMKNATNLSNGSFVKTYGYNSYDDGQGGYYKVRTMLNTDVIDNKTIVALHDPSLIAELIISIYVETYNSVADMKNANNLVDGRIVRTCGYYSVGDGGSALYKIRKFVVSDVTNNSTLILLTDTNYVAELLVNGCINVKQFGAKGDGVTDDTTALQDAFSYLRTFPRGEKDYAQLYFPDGEYILNDTILINGGRWSKVYGRASIKSNMNKPMIRLDSTMWYVFEDLLFWNENNETNSCTFEIENSYTNKFTDISIRGGYKGVNIIYGNQLMFDNVSIQNCSYGVYTNSHGDNTENMFVNCTMEASSIYNIYLGYDGLPYYGKYIFDNCYIEGDTDYALIYVQNGMMGVFNDCYINNTKNGGVLIHQTGTIPFMKTTFNNCFFVSTSGNGYLVKQLADNGITKGVKFNDENIFDESITLYNTNDPIVPKVGLVNRKKLNIYNLTHFVADSRNKLIDWLGNGVYTLSTPIDSESVNSINVTSQYVYKKIYLKAGVTYDFEVITQSNAEYSSMELFNEVLDRTYFTAPSYARTWTKLRKTYTPTVSQIYTLLLRSHNNTSSFCGLNIYSNEVDMIQNRQY